MTHPSAHMHTCTRSYACGQRRMNAKHVPGVGKHMLTQPRKEERVMFVYNCKTHYAYFWFKTNKKETFQGLQS